MGQHNKIELNNIYFNITGPDGAGKDSILSNVLKSLTNFITFREPGGTEEAEVIRNIILCISDKERKKYFEEALKMSLLKKTREYVEKAYEIFSSFGDLKKADKKSIGLMEAYLYAASRNESNKRLVVPSLNKGLTVIGSRSVACSMAYQANARNLGYDVVWKLNEPVLEKLPDFEIYLDIPTEIAIERLSKRKEKQDRLDIESFEFHRKSREGYLTYYNRYCPYPVYKIEALGTIEENTEKVLEILTQYKKTTVS